MGSSTKTRTQGVYTCKDGTYEVDAWYRKERIRRRGFTRLADAESYLIDRKAAIARGTQAGTRPRVTLDEAAANHLDLKVDKPSWETDKYLLEPVVELCGSLYLDEVNDATLKPFVDLRRAAGLKSNTINEAIGIVQTICNRAAGEWRWPNNMTWLEVAPKLTKLEVTDARPPRPISWDEQRLQLMPRLPGHLCRMALFDLNTGLREEPLCQLRWDWEARVILRPGLAVSVFVVPRRYVKGRKRERIVVCNSVAQSVVDSQRGLHPERVFTYSRSVKNPKHRPVNSMNNTAWQKARTKAGLGDLHVHDLRHTVGMRLREAGVSERTQDEILWHSKGNGMTSHYAVAQLGELYDALELIAKPSIAGESLNLHALVRSMQIQAAVPHESPAQRKAA
ncbi:Site-specific recombinase XerC [Bordetella ansorpii]|uniref:Site-specific recombinase XerC n=1 Tax=Bordetella ansorpii TaxID=288768 RepID=A0A157RM96_9BORD|nr:tyrosine-type recombinase/integrase [Bordetella ansorpii]SAI59122.1 Site-specific recombinase XerC [Bordetella ansorpii]